MSNSIPSNHSSGPSGVFTPQVVSIEADAAEATREVSPTLYGLFYEDLNRASDGGLNANVIANHTFDGAYLDRRLHNELIAMTTKRRGRTRRDPARHWTALEGTLHVHDKNGITEGARFGRLHVDGTRAVLSNSGYQPAGKRGIPAIAARAGVDMAFSAWIDARSFDGAAWVRVTDGAGEVVGSAAMPLDGGNGWHRVATVIPVERSARVRFEFALEGEGSVGLDEVSLVAVDHWGAGDPRWSQGVFRLDLVQALAGLKPTFMRFPGGCVVEGMGGDNAYDWKRTVGPLTQRRADYNLWGLRVDDGDYSQSHQIGYYEFFLLCEDLGMHPMPIVPAGISCQFRSRECVRHDHPDFDRVLQDVLDLIDWATGDPGENEWAALRAEAGHPGPFPLKYLGIGNENYGPRYFENYTKIRDAVHARNPDIIPILSAGPFAQGRAFDGAWEFAAGESGPLLIDEHFYKSPAWFLNHADRYDNYRRTETKVFVGEYAARAVSAKSAPNTFESALAEAAFLTGIERNSDVVAMTSYAPLLNNVGSRLWAHNLIDFNPDTVLPTVNYEVQKLFGNSVGDLIVPISGELPPGVFASSTTTDLRQNVKIVNTTGNQVRIELHLPRVADGVGSAVTLHAEPDAANSLDFNGIGTTRLAPRSELVPVASDIATVTVRALSVLSLDLRRRTD